MSEHPIDLSKLKKDPTGAGFYYAPVTVSKEMLAARSKFADLVPLVVPMFEFPDDGSLGEAGRAGLKHGPGGRGGSGPCDAGCRKCALEIATRDQFVVGDYVHGDISDISERWFEGTVETASSEAASSTRAAIASATAAGRASGRPSDRRSLRSTSSTTA